MNEHTVSVCARNSSARPEERPLKPKLHWPGPGWVAGPAGGSKKQSEDALLAIPVRHMHLHIRPNLASPSRQKNLSCSGPGANLAQPDSRPDPQHSSPCQPISGRHFCSPARHPAIHRPTQALAPGGYNSPKTAVKRERSDILNRRDGSSARSPSRQVRNPPFPGVPANAQTPA